MANRVLYFDIHSGISGDMTLACMIALGADKNIIAEKLSELLNTEINIKIKKVFINGISANQLKLEYFDNAPFRKFSDIKFLINESSLSYAVKQNIIGIFTVIAEAESEVHGMPAESVHFHEVGAMDSIIDIAGFCIALELLHIKSVECSVPTLGRGFVKCQHGMIPVPAPAVLKILKGMQIKRIDEPNEITTPTGAAFLKYFCKNTSYEFNGKILADSYSTGTKTLKTVPNLLRTLIYEINDAQNDDIIEIKVNIDDGRGENLGFLMDKLLASEALDVSFSPIFMKKNRPAYSLEVLCKKDNFSAVTNIILLNSTTAGFRYIEKKRIVMDRYFENHEYKNVNIAVKVLSYENINKFQPEWSDCVKASEITNDPPEVIYQHISSKFG